MNNKQLEKTIESELVTKSNLWNVCIITIAGTISLSFALDNWYKIFIVIMGITLSIIFLRAYFIKDIEIDKLINQMENKK